MYIKWDSEAYCNDVPQNESWINETIFNDDIYGCFGIYKLAMMYEKHNFKRIRLFHKFNFNSTSFTKLLWDIKLPFFHWWGPSQNFAGMFFYSVIFRRHYQKLRKTIEQQTNALKSNILDIPRIHISLKFIILFYTKYFIIMDTTTC